MSPRRLLGRRPSTPVRTSASSPTGQSLPSDVDCQTCRRVGIVGVVFAALWALTLFLNNVVAGWLGSMGFMRNLWPFPGNMVATVGFASSLLMVWLARRWSGKSMLLDMGSGYLVLQCLLVAILSQWGPVPISPRVSWVCIPILFYPAIVPNTPRKTLITSLLAASTEPVALGLSYLRGVDVPLNAFYLIWNFLPTYICAFLVVIPVKIIHRLGQQVRRARELGSYRLEEPLGKGGMGEVFRATHQMLARPAAVKLIRSEIIGSSTPAAARVIVERFRREAEAAASLRSPHTIGLYDFGVSQDGTFFLVMELLDGLDLETLVERFGPLPPERAVHLLRQACDSLAEAHARGLVHRDIKPSNIFTCRMGLEVDFVKVLDFGLVKAFDEPKEAGPALTRENMVHGTPAFIAPEQAMGRADVDARVDIYATGCVAYWLLTGRLVFTSDTPMGYLVHHIHTPPRPPSTLAELPIPPALDTLILSCLAKDPAQRPQSARELSRQLAEIECTRPWTEERAREWWDKHQPGQASPGGVGIMSELAAR
jgi:eukaryotic-like serine/threonine-protein kinase